jgi:hypothetical protein
MRIESAIFDQLLLEKMEKKLAFFTEMVQTMNVARHNILETMHHDMVYGNIKEVNYS